ncbi:DUF1353 domain-containing protein [Pseudomonas sp. NPDC098747]|uniref:DUF1353 domain-containing protein n=1 Tax=Pseudomonas sp. NPDC098747 TaxID=3364487 RepID=UPI00383A7C05
MSGFTEFSAPLNLEYDYEASKILDADYWRVTQEFRYYIKGQDDRTWVDVPAGYLTDGASVPRIFWSLIPPWGAYGQAAVVHDILCESLSFTVNGKAHSIARKTCDDILLETMNVLGVPFLKCQIIHKAVSLYRIFSGVDKATISEKKRALEVEWTAPPPACQYEL